MRSKGSPQAPVIRMFIDFADTVLWLAEPIAYEDSALSADLVKVLEAWEQSFYDSLTKDFDFRTAELARNHTTEGRRLAQWVAGEVGSGFRIEISGTDDPAAERYLHSDLPATNPAAARSFAALIAAAQIEADELAALAQAGGLYFYSPRTGEEFPSRAQRKKLGRG